MSPARRRRRWCFVWILPLIWTLVSFAAARHPGDGYALWAFGSAAGLWIIPIVGNVGSVSRIIPFVLAAGAASMAVIGLVLDLLRTPPRWWLMIWAVVAVAVCVLSLGAYPSYARAISKNGSLLAYVLFSLNIGLYAASLLMLFVMPSWHWTRRPPPPGHCPTCGYDLTGNRSGNCPECGHSIGPDT